MMQWLRLCLLLFVLALFLTTACVHPDPSEAKLVETTMFTKTNLRVYGEREISWKNEEDGIILPVGTEVEFLRIDSQEAFFADTSTGLPYTFYWHGSGDAYHDIFEQELHKYFTATNPKPYVLQLSPQERQLIRAGRLQVGMSRKAALIARGWPHNCVDPFKEDRWIYNIDWKSHMTVLFKNDRIVAITH